MTLWVLLITTGCAVMQAYSLSPDLQGGDDSGLLGGFRLWPVMHALAFTLVRLSVVRLGFIVFY